MPKSGLIKVNYLFIYFPPPAVSVPSASCTVLDQCTSSSKREENHGQCIYLLHPTTLDICIVIKNAELQAALQLGSLKRRYSYHCIFGRDGGEREDWYESRQLREL